MVIKSLGYIKFCEYIDGDNFYKLTNLVYGNTSSKNGKNLMNCFFGMLNKKFSSENNGFITMDEKIVGNALLENYNVNWFRDDEKIYVCNSQNTKRNNGDNCLIRQSIIWCGILNLIL